nr:SDR family NAD(P)-dependent oxidoreductase [Oscillospiraceae bacterium]
MEIAVVTGASSGMGREFVFAVDREYLPDEIWVIARREEKLAELAGSCRARIRALPWDLTDRASFGKYEALLREVSPRIRVLVNAAGYGLFGAFADLETEEQLGMADLNV